MTRVTVGPHGTYLPDAISRYFAASAANDIDAIVECFTEHATVVDDGSQYHGRQQIRAWREGVVSAYDYTSSIRGTETTAPDEYTVSTRLIGNFPGGQVDLTQVFHLRDGRIEHLRI